MYKTKQMSYNAKEKRICTAAVQMNISQERKNITRIDSLRVLVTEKFFCVTLLCC